MTNSIELKNVTLAYPTGPFVKGSIKSQIMRLFGLEEKLRHSNKLIAALRNISLQINEGERVGIIGSNGSGKSTLLRTIASIYPPYNGEVKVTGQIQSLFDIGLGFEGESTGRENIMYRGLVMGISPKIIRERTDEIIEFADIGGYIDMPVRTYSAGMFVRLAFAISTYLEGEVLLIDEVFGAGDANFAHKAIARINSLVDKAGIVVFVSHDLAAIRQICNRVIWLDKGVIKSDGAPEQAIAAYLSTI